MFLIDYIKLERVMKQYPVKFPIYISLIKKKYFQFKTLLYKKYDYIYVLGI
jgi:hypothetical protein